MNKEFNLERYLSAGVENIVKGAIRATLKDPKAVNQLTDGEWKR